MTLDEYVAEMERLWEAGDPDGIVELMRQHGHTMPRNIDLEYQKSLDVITRWAYRGANPEKVEQLQEEARRRLGAPQVVVRPKR